MGITNNEFQGAEINQQLSEFAKQLDYTNEEISNSVIEILYNSGEIIAQSQRKLISGRSKKLASLIKIQTVINEDDKEPYPKVTIGYDTPAIEEAPESVIIEFGRPGKKWIKGITFRKPRKGRSHHMKIGKITPTPHIRKGFDDVEETVVRKVGVELGKIIDENFWGW